MRGWALKLTNALQIAEIPAGELMQEEGLEPPIARALLSRWRRLLDIASHPPRSLVQGAPSITSCPTTPATIWTSRLRASHHRGRRASRHGRFGDKLAQPGVDRRDLRFEVGDGLSDVR